MKKLTKEEIIKRSLKSEKDIKNGKVKTLDELKKTIKKWLR